ncbi:MAG: siphovirus Gp157 family protein, partial [Oscillospiraceae bacterium]
LSENYERLFNEFDRINNIEYELTQLENGMYTDENGDLIPDVVEYKNELLQAWFDTLDGLEGEIEEKLESLACYQKELTARAAAISTERKKLELREKREANKAKSISAYLLDIMARINRRKIEMPRAALSVSDGRESVKIADEQALISWAQENGRDDLLSYKQPEISKKAVKAALSCGEDVPYVSLEKKPSITIK